MHLRQTFIFTMRDDALMPSEWNREFTRLYEVPLILLLALQ